MNLARLFASYEYLYSPKSWLHLQNSKTKLTIVFLQLMYLPVISLKDILACLLFLLFLWRSIEIPQGIKNYFLKSWAISILFVLISAKTENSYNSKVLCQRKVLRLSLFNIQTSDGTMAIRSTGFSFYLPASALRFISIHLIYLFSIRLLLLTTKHSNMLKVAIAGFKYFQHRSRVKFTFIVMASSQFLKIISEQIEIARIAYILRAIDEGRTNNWRVFFSTLISFIRLFAVNINITIFIIAHTLYSKEIQYSNLSIYNYFYD